MMTQEEFQQTCEAWRQTGRRQGFQEGVTMARQNLSSQIGEIHWVPTSQLVADTLELAKKIPSDIDVVVGVPRTGMIVASLLATKLGLPLGYWNQDSGVWELVGNGRREIDNDFVKDKARILVIDDSVNTSWSMSGLRSGYKWKETAAVYVNPLFSDCVDIVGKVWPMPHFFEWHFFGSDLVKQCAFDMDGIICEDCPPECDDDGDKYIKWMETVEPKWLPRPCVVPAIITSRLQKYRDLTTEWLEKHGVKYDELYMGPWDKLADRNVDRVVEHKAGGFVSCGCKIFIESCKHQAQAIHNQTQRTVICPPTGQVFQFSSKE